MCSKNTSFGLVSLPVAVQVVEFCARYIEIPYIENAYSDFFIKVLFVQSNNDIFIYLIFFNEICVYTFLF